MLQREIFFKYRVMNDEKSFITANMTGKKYDLLQRIQALAFLGMGMKIEDVGRMTEFPRSALTGIRNTRLFGTNKIYTS